MAFPRFPPNTDSPTVGPSFVSPAIISWTDFLIAFIGIFVIIVTVTGNILVIVSYWQDRHIRSIPGNQFILSLSVADLMVGCVSLPLYLQNFILKRWLLGDILCKLYSAFDYFVVTVGVLTVINISLDRYWIVIKNLKYRSFLTKRRSRVMIITSWLASLLVIPTLLLSWPSISGEEDQYHFGICGAQIIRSSLGSVLIVIIQVILPSVCILYLNISIFIHICLQDRRFRGDRSSRNLRKATTSRTPEGLGDDTKVFTIANEVESTPNVAGIRENDAVQGGATCSHTGDNSYGGTRLYDNGVVNEAFAESESDVDLNKHERRCQDVGFGIAVPSISVAPEECKADHVHCDIEGIDTSPENREGSICNVPSTQSKSCSNISMTLDITCQTRELNLRESPEPRLAKQTSDRFRIHETRQVSRIQHAALMLSTLLLAFVICWTPFAAIRIYDSFCEAESLNRFATELTGDLVWLNSTINPIIYAVTNPRFRKNFIRLLHMRACCQNN